MLCTRFQKRIKIKEKVWGCQHGFIIISRLKYSFVVNLTKKLCHVAVKSHSTNIDTYSSVKYIATSVVQCTSLTVPYSTIADILSSQGYALKGHSLSFEDSLGLMESLDRTLVNVLYWV